MAGFDPDAYLAQKPAAAPAAFDPDAYLAAVGGGPRATGTLVDQIPGSSVKAPAATQLIIADRPQTFGERVMGVIETPAALAANMVTGLPVYLAGAGGPKFQQSVAEQIQYQPRTQTARNALESIGRGMEATKLPPFMPTVAGVNMLTQSVTPATRAVTDFGGAKMAQRTERLAQEASAKDWARAPQIEAAQAAQRLGVAINPAEANPNVKTKLLVGATGEALVNAKAAKVNAPKWNELARQDLGLPENTPLTAEAFEKARSAHSAPYDTIRKIGVMQASDDVMGELGGLKLDPLSTSSPEKAAKVNAVVDRVIGQVENGLSGDNVVGQIRGFRKDANQVLKNPNASPIDIDVAETNLSIANALENLVENNISNPKALSDFRKARTAIAKTYDWERATGVTTKQVDPLQVAKLAEKGKPLTGVLADVANVAGNFPDIANLNLPKEPLLYQRLRRGGAGGTAGFVLGGGPVGAAIGAGLTSLGSEATANMLARPGIQNRLAIPADRRIALPTTPVEPMAPIPQSRAVVPFDYSQQAFVPPNFTIVPEQYGPRVGPAPSPIEIQRGLPAPSAEGTLNALRTEDARRAQMSRTLGQQVEAQQAAAEASGRRPARGEVILDINPLTGVPEISKGLKGATPATFSDFGASLKSASDKITAGKAFDMTAAEKVAWDKTRADLAEVAPGFKSLNDKAVMAKMQDRAWVQDAIGKAQEKARAFQDIAARANTERLRQDALMKREQMMDLLETLEEQFGKGRPVKTGGQGPKTRAFQRNMLTPEQEIQNALVK